MSTPNPRRRRGAVLIAAALSMPLLATTVVPTAAAAGPAAPASVSDGLPAPRGLRATRDAAEPSTFVISWRAVPGDVHHYNVSVFSRGHDSVRMVGADTTSLKITGGDLSAIYRITVSSRDAAGAGTTSGPIWLWPAVASAPAQLKIVRDPGGTSMTATWVTPLRQGYTPVDHYEYTLTQLSRSAVVAEGTTTEGSLAIGDLDPQRQYVLKVRAVNQQGSGSTGVAVLGNDRPGAPPRATVTREESDPGTVVVSWVAPAYGGYAPIDHYEVFYGVGWLRASMSVPADQFTATVPLDSSRVGLVAVRACSAAGCGQLSTVTTVTAVVGVPTDQDTASTNPMVDVQEQDGTIRVEVNGVIGSTIRYPRLVVRILPTAENGGFTDTQWGQNGAQLLTFRTVPTGTYTVTVHGVTGSGSEVELARKLVIVGDAGLTVPADWKVVYGRATIGTNVVDMPNAGEHRVLSVRPRTSQDMVLTTTATLRYGWGYGIWFRAGLNANNKIDGYTFQYDPMFGNKFIIRIWNDGRECSVPLATSPFPRGFQENVAHLLTVVVQGDAVWATVDGAEMFRIDSLTRALSSVNCAGFKAPTGTGVGFRTWSTSSAVFENTTLS